MKSFPRFRTFGVLLSVLLVSLLAAPPAGAQGRRGTWGRIANPSHRGERLLSALFFAGPPNPGSLPLYTRHPRADDARRWSDDAHMDATLQEVASVGLNTLKLSYWGHDGETDASSPAWLFSQKRWPGDAKAGPYTEAEQVALARRFWDRARAQNLLVAPMLEVSPKFPFYADFPGNIDPLVARAAWLLKNFGDEPNWLRVYDQNGQPRHVIWLIETVHAAPIDSETFADGFGRAAVRLQTETGYDAGFIIDPTPLPGYGPEFGPDPDALRRHASVLAVNPFNITSQGPTRKDKQSDITEDERLQYAESVLRRWSASGLPLIAPILPGYDAHVVFPGNGVYGFNAAWRRRQRALALQYETDGLSVDIWNGWTEGYAIPPSVEDGDVNVKWVADVIQALQAKWRK